MDFIWRMKMVEPVEIVNTKYLSKDGKMYDTYEKAETADKEFEQKNSFDPAKEVARLEKMTEINFSRIQKQIDNGKDAFPSFWMTEQKYGQDYYMCSNFSDMEEMGWSAFLMWYDYYICHDDETVSVVEAIKLTENKKAALAFVLDRVSQGYEYERLEKIAMIRFGDKNG
jgi:hypothetical protein